MYQNLRQAGANSSEQTQLPTGLQVGPGRARRWPPSRNFTQGNLQQTSNPLDVAIKGNGFFQIQMPDGTTGYTRDGSFQVDAQGQLVTNNGYAVQPGITIPANAQSVTIAADGTVSVHAAGPGRAADGGPDAARQLRQPGRPRAARQNLFAETAASGTPQRRRAGQQRPGHAAAGLSSRPRNVNVVEELVGDDPDAARLRDQLQGDPDLRPDAAAAGAAVMRAP